MRYLLIVLVLISSGSVITDSGSFLAKLAVNSSLFLCLLLVTSKHLNLGQVTGVVLGRFFLLFFAIALSTIFSDSIYNQSSLTLLLKLVCSVLLAIYISKSFDYFFGAYLQLIHIIVALSLVLHVTAIFLPSFLTPVPEWMDQGKGYLTLLGVQYYPPGDNLFRNAAFFWEPGVFACLIMLAVMYQLSKRRYPSLLLVAGVISTGSLGGFFIFLITIFLKSGIVFFRRPVVVLGLIAVLMVLFGGYLFEIASYLSEAIFNRPLTADQSFAARQIDLYYPFLVALDSPIYGFGLNDMRHYVSSALAEGVTGQVIITNSWGIIAYSFGYVVLGLFVLLLGTSLFVKKVGLIYIISLYLMFAHEPLALSVMVVGIVLAYGTKQEQPSLPATTERF